MFTQYFKQALWHLRENPVISWISVLGTALSICMIMVTVITLRARIADCEPEVNRSRSLYVPNMSYRTKGDTSGSSAHSSMSVQTGRECFKPLTTAEAVTLVSQPGKVRASLPAGGKMTVDKIETDEAFWQIFRFRFLDGKPFTGADVQSGLPRAVIAASVARRLFGRTDVTGQHLELNHVDFQVCGVVADVSMLATDAYAQVWIPYTSTDTPKDTDAGGIMGNFSCALLARSRADFPAIREESDRSVRAYNDARKEEGWEIFMRNRPYNQEKNAIAYSSNNEPDLQGERNRRLMVYLILLIVPAINLSSMTQSRLRQRVAEIGVRRAFGCTRAELAGQILAENFIVTLLAGVIGFILSILFAFTANELLFAQNFSRTLNPPLVDASILIHASTFLWALLFCFVLNLLSAGIPAWRAVRMNIVESIGGRLH